MIPKSITSRLIISLFFILLLLIPAVSWSQAIQNLRFSEINSDNGLSSNGVNDIVTDSLGFVWMATSDGLCRYYSTSKSEVFKENSAKPERLQSSNIRALLVDSKNNLWIGTRLGGLTKYNQKNNSWKTYRNDPEDPTSLSNDEVLSLMEDSNGNIWVGTENGLNVLDTATQVFHQFIPDEKDEKSVGASAILTIMEDSKGWIWVGTWGGGLNLLIPSKTKNIADATFRKFIPINKEEAKRIWKIYQDKQKRYWVGTRGVGLFLMQLPENADLENNNWYPQFHSYTQNENDPNAFSNNFIQDIFQDSKDNLWVSTTQGVNLISPTNLPSSTEVTKDAPEIIFHKYYANSNDPKSLLASDITSIHEDKQGILWFGSYYGVSKYNPSSNQFDNHDIKKEAAYFSNQTLHVNRAGKAWMVTRGKGIWEYDFDQRNLKPVKHFNKKIPNKFYSAIYCPDQVNLFLADGTGIIHYNMDTEKIKYHKIPDNINKKIQTIDARFIFYDSKKRIWLGGETGLFIFHGDDKCSYIQKSSDPNSLSDNAITSVYEDSKGSIWISTYNGLNRLIIEDFDNPKFERFKYINNSENSIISNSQIALLEVDEVLYIGTMVGLCAYDLNKKVFTNYSKNEKKDFFLSLVSVGDGNIWGRTSDGIVFFDVKNKIYNRFYKKDGLGTDAFKLGNKAQCDNGYIYFENDRGITRFKPNELLKNSTPPKVFVTNGKVMSTRDENNRVINGISDKEIILNHNDYYISLNFIANNYNRPEKNLYAYKLEGFEEKWNYTSSGLKAVYTNLKAGEYKFRVKASNNDGVWNEEGTTISVIKKPALWETWWGQFIALCSILLLIAISVNLYTKHIKARNARLKKFNQDLSIEITERKKVEKALQEREQYMEHLVKERTLELEKKKLEVEALLQDIQERNEILEKVVEKRTKKLIESNQELSRSNLDLEQFAYIASHDLQEPLRNIGNFTGLLSKKYGSQLDDRGKEYIEIVVSGVQRMSKLIYSILTYSQVGKNNIEFEKVDLNKLLGDKLQDLSQKISERNVIINKEDLPHIYGEPEQLSMIFYNLINNAIKFNQSENPLVEIRLHSQSVNFWTFSIKDNGIGIAKTHQAKIFEIFKRLHGKEEYQGTGIGLAVCKKIVHRHRGEIWVESIEGKGTTFFFTISKHLQKLNQERFSEEQAKKDFKTMMN